MSTPLQDVVVGQPFSMAAASVNAWNKAARALRPTPKQERRERNDPNFGAVVSVQLRGDFSSAMAPIAQLLGSAVPISEALEPSDRKMAIARAALEGSACVKVPNADGETGVATSVFLTHTPKMYGAMGTAVVKGFVPMVSIDSSTSARGECPPRWPWASPVGGEIKHLKRCLWGTHRLLYKVDDVLDTDGEFIEGREWWAVDWNSRPAGMLVVPVTLTTDSGSQSTSNSTPATWDYNVFLASTADADFQLEGVTKDVARPNGKMSEATKGLLAIIPGEDSYLTWTNEIPITGPC